MTSLGFTIKKNIIPWEGLTFQQVVATIQKNSNNMTQTKSFFYPPPLKQFRKNIGKTTANLPSSSNERQSVSIAAVMEQPGGASYTTVSICSNNGVAIFTDPNIPNSTYEKACYLPDNALKKVRSAGMIRKRTYNVNSTQYLQNRDRTFSQNQFNYLKNGNAAVEPGSPLATNNTYVQNGSGQFNVANNVVIYKPNNAKYGCQGGVSGSSRIERIKYETIEKVAYAHKQIYGSTSNDYRRSTTFGGSYGPYNGTTFGTKDLYNVPTPAITVVNFSR